MLLLQRAAVGARALERTERSVCLQTGVSLTVVTIMDWFLQCRNATVHADRLPRDLGRNG